MITLKQFIVYFVDRKKGFLEIMDAASLGKEQWLKNSCRTGVHEKNCHSNKFALRALLTLVCTREMSTP